MKPLSLSWNICSVIYRVRAFLKHLTFKYFLTWHVMCIFFWIIKRFWVWTKTVQLLLWITEISFMFIVVTTLPDNLKKTFFSFNYLCNHTSFLPWSVLVNIVNRSRHRLTSCQLKKQTRHLCDVCTPSSDCMSTWCTINLWRWKSVWTPPFISF